MSARTPFWENESVLGSAATRELRHDDGALAAGARLGEWTVESLLGEGGSSRVYCCRKGPTLRAAVKVLADATATDDFLREARLLMKLRHPRVVRVLDAGTTTGGQPYIALELLKGRTLEAALTKRWSPQPTIRLLSQALDALGAVHRAGLVHRDVKPTNLFLSMRDSQLTLLDFGIAREGVAIAPTSSTHVKGTLDYLAPEQLDMLPSTPVSDLYALGCVAYRVVMGRPPFSGGNIRQQILARAQLPDVPASPWAPFLTALLAPRPEARPRSAAAAKAMLPPTPKD